MNNKGMTLIELIVAFSLLIVVSLGIFGLVTNVNKDLNSKEKIKELNDYSNLINRKIHTDIIKNKPFVVAYKNKKLDNFVCKTDEFCNINNKMLNTEKDNISESINLEKECLDTYPCVVYGYIKDNKIEFKSIILKIEDENDYGIKYDGVFEKIITSDVRFGKERQYFTVDEKGFFIMDYPLYLIGETNNYGFKIAYPLLNK